MICKKCGKEMPIDKEKSNKNWIVYRNKCECGGNAKLFFDDDDEDDKSEVSP